jgi:hypothetical protein
MRTQDTQAKKVSNESLSGAWASLLLLAGLIVSLEAPTRVATSFVEVGRPERAEVVATTPDTSSTPEMIAENATLDLQLD